MIFVAAAKLVAKTTRAWWELAHWSGTIWGFVGIVIGVLGVAVGVWLHYHPIRGQIVCWQTNTTVLSKTSASIATGPRKVSSDSADGMSPDLLAAMPSGLRSYISISPDPLNPKETVSYQITHSGDSQPKDIEPGTMKNIGKVRVLNKEPEKTYEERLAFGTLSALIVLMIGIIVTGNDRNGLPRDSVDAALLVCSLFVWLPFAWHEFSKLRRTTKPPRHI
jgi:hypothetical protein